MGLCFGLKHPQHFLQIKVLTRGVSLLKEVFPEKKKSAFLVLQVSGTLKYSVV